MNIWKGVAAAVLAVPLVSAGFSASAQDQSKTLVVAVPSDPVGVEPGANKAEPIGSEIILNVFDTLVAWTAPDFQKLEGCLATSWTISPDGKEFSLKLRDGVKFQDGTPFDAAAVKFSLERTKAANPYVKATFDLIKDIAVVSPSEVKITLSAAYPAFLSILAQPQAAIVSPTAVEKLGDKFAATPVGTGPFVFKSAQADTNIVLEANPDYFRGAPKLSKIIYRVVPDASTRRLELESGGVDIVQQQGQLSAIAAEDIEALKRAFPLNVTAGTRYPEKQLSGLGI